MAEVLSITYDIRLLHGEELSVIFSGHGKGIWSVCVWLIEAGEMSVCLRRWEKKCRRPPTALSATTFAKVAMERERHASKRSPEAPADH